MRRERTGRQTYSGELEREPNIQSDRQTEKQKQMDKPTDRLPGKN